MKIKEFGLKITMKNSIFFLIILFSCIFLLPGSSYADGSAPNKSLENITYKSVDNRSNYQQFLAKYDELLKDYTKPTSKNGISFVGVNYDSWSKDQRHSEALKLFKSINISKIKDKKAFWINAYNFLTIELIIKEDEKKSIKNLATVLKSPWKRFSWELNGENYTLDKIEHEILRPLGDPSIHFAINCASVSCPDVRSDSYRSETLDQQLTEQVQLALKDKNRGLRIDGSKIYVHKLFKWFDKDFDNGDVKGWISKYTDIKSDAKIKYLDYDWSLNKVY